MDEHANLASLRKQRQREKDAADKDIWMAMQEVANCLTASGVEVPEDVRHIINAHMLRGGAVPIDAYTDGELMNMMRHLTAGEWQPAMGQILPGDIVIGGDGKMYFCMVGHYADEAPGPGSPCAGHSLRVLRDEPEEGYLDVAWGERVAYGCVRRDPSNGELYTPTDPAGVVVYEPNYPSLTPTLFEQYNPVLKWTELSATHQLHAGDVFEYSRKRYIALKDFIKSDDLKPPKGIDDYYEAATE